MVVFQVGHDHKFETVIVPRVLVSESEVTQVNFTYEQKKALGKYCNEQSNALTETPVAILPNANNHGYCRAVLDKASLNHFIGYLSSPHIDDYNRAYLWRILFDHVRMLKLTPEDYLKTFEKHFGTETEQEAMTYTLMKCNYILKMNLLALPDVEQKNARMASMKEVIDKKIENEFNNVSVRNMLLNYSIIWTNLSDDDAAYDFLDMVNTMQLNYGPKSKNPVVNKSQRYLCLRRLCVDGHDI